MSNPNPIPIQIAAPEVVQKGTKSVVATLTTAVGVLTLFGAAISDGSLDWSEAGTLIGAIATAVITVGAVWRVPNEVQSVTMRSE